MNMIYVSTYERRGTDNIKKAVCRDLLIDFSDKTRKLRRYETATFVT